MLTQSTIGLVRRRWVSERPYAGHTKDSLERKLACPAVEAWAKEHAARELAHRRRIEDIGER